MLQKVCRSSCGGPCSAEHAQGRINHSGAPYQRKAKALSSYAYQEFSLGVHFSSPQKLTTFLVVVVTFKPTLTQRSNVKTAW